MPFLLSFLLGVFLYFVVGGVTLGVLIRLTATEEELQAGVAPEDFEDGSFVWLVLLWPLVWLFACLYGAFMWVPNLIVGWGRKKNK